MHSYREAIGHRPKPGSKPVESVWVLYPGTELAFFDQERGRLKALPDDLPRPRGGPAPSRWSPARARRFSRVFWSGCFRRSNGVPRRRATSRVGRGLAARRECLQSMDVRMRQTLSEPVTTPNRIGGEVRLGLAQSGEDLLVAVRLLWHGLSQGSHSTSAWPPWDASCRTSRGSARRKGAPGREPRRSSRCRKRWPAPDLGAAHPPVELLRILNAARVRFLTRRPGWRGSPLITSPSPCLSFPTICQIFAVRTPRGDPLATLRALTPRGSVCPKGAN